MSKKIILIILTLVFIITGAATIYYFYFSENSNSPLQTTTKEPGDFDRTGILEYTCGPTDAPVMRISLTGSKINEPSYTVIDMFIDVSEVNDLELEKLYVDTAFGCDAIDDYSSCVPLKTGISFIEIEPDSAKGNYTIYKDNLNQVIETGEFQVDLEKDREICG